MILDERNPNIVCCNCYTSDNFEYAVGKLRVDGYNESDVPVLGFISIFLRCRECNTRMNIAFHFDISSLDDLKSVSNTLGFKLDPEWRTPELNYPSD